MEKESNYWDRVILLGQNRAFTYFYTFETEVDECKIYDYILLAPPFSHN